jgi:hypothetical protein
MHAGVMMTATPPQGLLDSALNAGLLNLQHKVLNATSVRPVELDMDVLRMVRATENSDDIVKLLTGAQMCGFRLSDQPRYSFGVCLIRPKICCPLVSIAPYQGEQAEAGMSFHAYRELNSLMGVAKLTYTVVCAHEEPDARKATILQLSPPALACMCLAIHPFMSNPEKAIAGGTTKVRHAAATLLVRLKHGKQCTSMLWIREPTSMLESKDVCRKSSK